MKTRRFGLCISLVAGLAAVLVPMSASAGERFVDIQSVDPTIIVELRYAARNNLVGQPLYPSGTRALARPEVASALAVAQGFLRRYQYGLKSGMRTGRWQSRRSFGRHYTTVIMLPILKSVLARCIVGASPSMPRWWMHGIVPCACQRTLMILPPRRRGA